jgi:branched-chain amino acid transport system permease protein
MAALWQYVLGGVVDGAIFALVAAGFVLIYQVTGIINFAQGEFVMIGGMTAAALAHRRGMPLIPAAAIAVLVSAAAGALAYLLAIRPARNATPLTLLFITLGVDVALRGLALFVWGTNPYSLNAVSAAATRSCCSAARCRRRHCGCSAPTCWSSPRCTCSCGARRWARRCAPPLRTRRSHRRSGFPLRTFAFWSFVVAAAIGGLGGVVIAPITSASTTWG